MKVEVLSVDVFHGHGDACHAHRNSVIPQVQAVILFSKGSPCCVLGRVAYAAIHVHASLQAHVVDRETWHVEMPYGQCKSLCERRDPMPT